MTLKYESEILYKLMERDGFNIPSSVPPYESEIKAYLIDQVKQAYPKLTDYEAEWLLYNYTKHIPAEFPISSVSDVTKATFENVVPFAYQSAILKGQTLVNICKPFEFDIQTTGSGLRHICDKKHMFNIPIQDDKQYSIWIEIDVNEIGPFSLSHTGVAGTLVFDGVLGLTLTHGSKIIYPCVKRADSSNVTFSIGALEGSTEGRLKGRIMVFEGDIRGFKLSYFTGMQSVKMPVLTTTGKNLFDIGTMLTKNATVENGVVIKKGEPSHTLDMLKITNLEIGKTYTLSCDYSYDGTSNGGMLVYCLTYDEGDYNGAKDNIKIGVANTKQIKETFVAKKDTVYFLGSIWQTYISNIQLEEGSTATPYEPYKTIILPANILTTTGKNLFDGKLEYGLLSNKDGRPLNSNDYVRSQNFIPINCEKITFTVINGECGLSFYYYDKDKNFISNKVKTKVSDDLSIPKGVAYLKFRTYPISDESITNNLNTQIQIEEGKVATEYEPYKTNILTVNEEVELGSVGDVKDELNLLTGELTQRTREVTYSNDMKITLYTPKENSFYLIFGDKLTSAERLIIADKIPHTSNWSSFINNANLSCYSLANTYLYLTIPSVGTVGEAKQYLSNLNPIFRYALATESVKTVDLTAVNEKGETTYFMPLEGTMSVQSSGEIIQPTFDMSVPVEATTQNLAAFIDLEME